MQEKNDGNFFSIFGLIVFAIVSQHIVSWAGSILSSIASEETNYAVFTFSDDRYLPMTTNILMNVCIPNVFMIFIFMYTDCCCYALYYVERKCILQYMK